MDKVKDILIVNVSKSYNENTGNKLNEDYLEICTQEAWKLADEKVENEKIKYIVGIKNGEIEGIYGVSGNPTKDKKNGRYKFKLENLDDEMDKKIRKGIDENNINLKYVVIKYLCSEDILK